MPDLGIGEAIAAVTSLIGEGAADVGAAAATGIGELGGAVGAGFGGLGEALGGSSGIFADFLGTGGGAEAASAAAADPLVGGLTGATTPAAAAGGLAPAAAGPVDIASSLGAGGGLGGDVTAFSGATGGGLADTTGGIFGGIEGIPSTPFTGGLLNTAETGFSPAEVGGFDATSVAGGGLPGVAAPGADAAGLAPIGGATGAPTSDLASLTGAGSGATSTGATGLPATGGAAGGSGSGGFLDSLTTGAVNSITKNPLGIGLGAAGLGYNILAGQKATANVNAVTNAAAQESAQGATLQSYLQNGNLPLGLQAQVDNATKAAKARIISGYAARGQNADPAQNSALAQELNQVDINAVAAAGQMQTQLLTTGINETNMSNQLYEFLVGNDQKQAQLTGQAISNFAAAMAGGPKTIQIGTGATG